jgi:DnaJ-class molecular chaperone
LSEPYFDDDYFDDDAMICETCWGEGSGEECEMMLDWVNYGTAWITCPDCKGTGRIGKEG